ncbi:UBC-like protein [Xylariaceae sp. FL1651]|nr:UBC-like protein [Xylariaceae sp. FL1651]
MSLTAAKRMMAERAVLEEEKPEYKVFFHNDNLLKFDVYIVALDDSVYKHKLVKLEFNIPPEYPMVPPKVNFRQHTGGRIHPNFYPEGLVCLSILNTWAGNDWTPTYTIHTVISSIRALFDNDPYRYEPGEEDGPKNQENAEYNEFVQYASWRPLLIDYLKEETSEPAKAFLKNFVREHSDSIMTELAKQAADNESVICFYEKYSDGVVLADYEKLIEDMKAAIAAAVA